MTSNIFTFSGGSKVDEALELYSRAANSFKMAKKWGSAGNAFLEAANLHVKNGSRHDAANMYVDAANCFKKSDQNGQLRIHLCLFSCSPHS
jgi:alpha-soluble NSF attachment protein